MVAAANAEFMTVSLRKDRENARRQGAALDPNDLTPHLRRDLGIVDFDTGRDRQRLIEVDALRAGWL